ncbi:MAG: transposase [Bacteroidales bacterium]|nr:transposase [Bacteroidales bacterium]MBR1433509.1 transposase [Bacteroidales bacterium]
MKKYYLGIDVSKKELSYSLRKDSEGHIASGKIDNETKTIRTFLRNILKNNSITKEQLVVGAEYTGYYSNLLAGVCVEEGLTLWLEHPARMKDGFKDKSKNKTDKEDAKRIADYIWRYSDMMVEYKPKDASILKLKALLRTKASLMKQLHTYTMQLSDEAKFIDKPSHEVRDKILSPVVGILKSALEETEKEIEAVISADPVLANQDRRIQTVTGVGPVISHNMICLTEGFTKFKDAHAFMNYCGMIPIYYESGTSVYLKPKTSNASSHVMKPKMYMACLGFTGEKNWKDSELHDYYVRKTEGEGKHHNCTTNVMMAKLIARIFAVVREDRDYLPEKEYNKKYHPERCNKEAAAAS